jgi:NADH dehydrogenase (ubiquinone) 1 beta subcomplex subunit 8
MLPLRIVRTTAARAGVFGARSLPAIQRRGFIPSQYSDKKILDEKYPDPQTLSAAQDPEMVGSHPAGELAQLQFPPANRMQNGGYINPPAIKRQHRDPHADWWDPQERRNFGEPVHEDNDVLGIFSPWDYTWTTTGPGLVMIGTFIATVLGVSGVVYFNYPDRIAYPREFEAGLERELGGPGAVRARQAGDEDP